MEENTKEKEDLVKELEKKISNPMQERILIAAKIEFHKSHLNQIKKNLGASYTSWLKDAKGVHHIRVIKDGKENRFELFGDPNDVDRNSYYELNKTLLEFYKEEDGKAIQETV